MLDENIVMNVFGGIIDQSGLSIADQRQLYEDTIEKKYGEPPEKVLARLKPLDRPLAEIQLIREMAQDQERRRRSAEDLALVATKRAEKAEKKLKEVEKYRKKMEAKKERGRRKTKKQKSKSKKMGETKQKGN